MSRVTPPPLPRPGDPIAAAWFRQLVGWIQSSVIPRGDGRTTRVSGNVVTALGMDTNRLTVSAINVEAAGRIGMGSVVSVYGAAAEDDIHLYFRTYRTGDEKLMPVGVLLTDVDAGELGDLVLAGVVDARIAANPSGLRFGTPSSSGIIAPASSGMFRLLCPAAEAGLAPVTLLPVSEADEYRNYFKVEQVSGLTCRVIDGANPSNTIAGKTDIGNVSPATLTLTGAGSVYCVAVYDTANNIYQLSLASTLPASGSYGAVELATVAADGTVTQRWTGGEIVWKERYWV